MARILVLLVCVFMSQGVRAERKPDALEMEVAPFFNGQMRVQRWSGVNVQLHNPGSRDLDVTVEAWFADVGSGGVRFQRHLSLPRQALIRFPIYVLPSIARRDLRVVCQDRSGRVLAGGSLEVGFVPETALHVACAGRFPAGVDKVALGTGGGAGSEQTRTVTSFFRLEDLPKRSAGLEPVDILVLSQTPLEGLNQAQGSAILAWVEQGGVLVLAPGNEWQSYRGEPASALLPGRLTGMGKAGKGALDTELPLDDPAWAAALKAADAPVLRGEFTGAETVLAASGVPLVLRWRRARGTVILLTFPPEVLSQLGQEQAGRFFAALFDKEWARSGPSDGTPDYNQIKPSRALAGLLAGKASREVGAGWLILIIVTYLLVVGPGDYFLVRRMRRPVLTWVTFPAFVILFSGVSYWKAYRLKAGPMQLNQVSIVDVSPDRDYQAVRTWTGVYSQHNQTYEARSELPDALWGTEAEEFLTGGVGRPVVASQGDDEPWIQAHIPIWTMKLLRHDSQQAGRWLTIRKQDNATAAHLAEDAPFSLTDCVFISQGKAYILKNGVSRGSEVCPEKVGQAMPFDHWLSFCHGRTSAILRNLGYGSLENTEWQEPPATQIRDLLHLLTFPSSLPLQTQGVYFLYADRFFDLTAALQHGQSIFIGWAEQPAANVPVKGSTPQRRELTLVRCVWGKQEVRSEKSKVRSEE